MSPDSYCWFAFVCLLDGGGRSKCKCLGFGSFDVYVYVYVYPREKSGEGIVQSFVSVETKQERLRVFRFQFCFFLN